MIILENEKIKSLAKADLKLGGYILLQRSSCVFKKLNNLIRKSYKRLTEIRYNIF